MNEASHTPVKRSTFKRALFPAVTISFNLARDASLSTAVDRVRGAEKALALPPSIQSAFQGAAQAFEDSLSSEVSLLIAALATVYIALGALPMLLGTGTGSELRRPLGLAIIGGLALSQLLTLFTTPVIYLMFDRLARRVGGRGASERPDAGVTP